MDGCNRAKTRQKLTYCVHVSIIKSSTLRLKLIIWDTSQGLKKKNTT